MFFNSFTIIILCIQANKVNTNIFETTNHSGQPCALSKFVNVKIWHYLKKKNHRFIDIWLLIITCHNFPQQLNDGNKSVWNTWGLPTMMQSFQQYNVPRLVLCLCRTTLALPVYSNTLHTSRGHKISNDSPMTSCVPDI